MKMTHMKMAQNTHITRRHAMLCKWKFEFASNGMYYCYCAHDTLFDLCVWKISLNRAVCGVHFSDSGCDKPIGNNTKLSNTIKFIGELHFKKKPNSISNGRAKPKEQQQQPEGEY